MSHSPLQPSPHSPRGHFIALDGLRGVAALAVVLFHSYKGGGVVPNGKLAVDLFFLLSGFVIAYAYDGQLQAGKVVDFLLRRVARLYPMIFIGAAGGIALAFLHNILTPAAAYPVGRVALSGFLSLLVLPYPFANDFGQKIFSFNPPLWSLFFELAANVVYALFAKRLTVWVLGVAVLLGLVGVVIGGPVGGGAQEDFWWGFPRVAAGVLGGVLLFKVWAHSHRWPHWPSMLAIAPAAVLAIFAAPIEVRGWLYVPVFLLMVGIVALLIGVRPGPKVKVICQKLGAMSYPLYAIHWLTLYLFSAAAARVFRGALPYSAVVVAHILVAPLIAYVLATTYELWGRKALMNLLLRSPMA